MDPEQEYRKEIARIIKDIYKRRQRAETFRPGQSPVRYAGRVYDEKEMILLTEASLDFWLTAGRFTKEFETSFAKYLGLRHAVLVNSGSSANLLAVAALTSPLLEDRRLKEGDEVITTAAGFPTTLNPIIQHQLVPVFVDVDLGTYNIDVKRLAKAVTQKTKAVMIPHTLGNPADLDQVLKVVKKHNLWLIEDNCDALGSRYQGRFTGTFGHLATFSFYPAHHITMGEGGAVATNDPVLHKILLSFRDWGRDCWCETGQDNTCKRRFSQKHGDLPFGYDHKYVYSHIGYNLKATDLQAAIGVAQMKKLDGFIKARQANFDFLFKNLRKYARYLLLPQATKGAAPSWFGFPICVRKNSRFSRGDIVNYLEKNKIATRMLFGGNLTKQPAYRQVPSRVVGSLQNTDTIMHDLFWIGVYPGIREKERAYILSVINKFFKDQR